MITGESCVAQCTLYIPEIAIKICVPIRRSACRIRVGANAVKKDDIVMR